MATGLPIPNADSCTVDSHTFWPEYTLTLDPSKVHTSTVADLRSSRTTPSTPSYPSLFHRARSLTLEVCLPCRLNHPNRLGLYPAQKKLVSWSNHLGAIPTCHRHRSKYCSCCLREENPGSFTEEQVILQVRLQDVDEKGRYFSNPIVCNECRHAILVLHIVKEMIVCARGGRPCDQITPVLHTVQAIEYMSFGQYNAIETARMAVREAWLNHHTDLRPLQPLLIELQRCENEIKRHYVLEQRYETEEMRLKRLRLVQMLFDESSQIIPDIMKGIFQEMTELYEDWNEDDDLEFEDDSDLQLCDIRQFVRNHLITLWVDYS